MTRLNRTTLSQRTKILLPLLLASACASTAHLRSAGEDRPTAASHAAAAGSSPISLEELDLIQQSLLFGEDDVEALRMSLQLLRPRTSEILDVWYGFVGSTPHLLRYFENTETGEPDGRYLAEVRKRFEQWIVDTASAEFDQDWLDRSHEIGLRHHSLGKNKTDGVASVPIVHFRYLTALVYPITATLRPFLESGEHDAADVERMHQAWIKAVLLQSILWSHPYVNEGEF